MADNNEISFTDSQTESQINSNLSETESKIMDEGIHSTPIQNKNSDDNNMMTYLCSMVCSMKESSDKQQAMLELKFSEQKSDSDAKFNVLKNQNNELKNEIQELNKCLEKNNEIIRTNLNKLEQSVERMGVHVMLSLIHI